jgi:hypothetical protein
VDPEEEDPVNGPLVLGSQLIRGALVGIGELVDRVVKPQPDAIARPPQASITIYSEAKAKRER